MKLEYCFEINWMKVKDTGKMREFETLNNIEWLEELMSKLFFVLKDRLFFLKIRNFLFFKKI